MITIKAGTTTGSPVYITDGGRKETTEVPQPL